MHINCNGDDNHKYQYRDNFFLALLIFRRPLLAEKRNIFSFSLREALLTSLRGYPMKKPLAASDASADVSAMCAGVLAGDRRWLAQAITLVESVRPADRLKADDLLSRLFEHTGKSLRVGITGVPGVGKSTFIESLSLHILAQSAQKIAVLSIDPSSPTHRGSVLADKTRMQHLAKREEVFIRPSPTAQALGGIAIGTRAALLLCEAAGYGLIFVETVGVGQSEVLVRDVADVCVLLLLGGAGDELQGIKRGILEVADIFLLHKTDRDDALTTKRNMQLYKNSLTMSSLSKRAHRTVMACSSLSGQGLKEVWAQLQAIERTMKREKSFHQKRADQAVRWLHHYLRQYALDDLYGNIDGHLAQKEQEVRNNHTDVRRVARTLFSLHKKDEL